MNLIDFLVDMQGDLANEYKHMLFYLHSAVVVQGMHRLELSEYFMEEAESEMQHVKEFGEMMLGMGGIPQSHVSTFPHLTNAKDILQYVLHMESEVVANYARRRRVAEDLGDPQAGILAEFYSDQLLDSQKTVNTVGEMLRGTS